VGGAFSPNFNVNKILTTELKSILSEDILDKVNGKLHLSMSGASLPPKNVVFNTFRSKDDLIEALVCSCFIPGFSAYQVPSFRNEHYYDGGLSNNLPILNEKTIRISPFAGNSHICPREDSKFTVRKFMGEEVGLTKANFTRFWNAVSPMNDLEDLYNQGYRHTQDFINSENFESFYHDFNSDETLYDENYVTQINNSSGPRN